MKRALVMLLVWWPAIVWAHKPSDSYLSLDVARDGVHGQWDVALRDLDRAVHVDDGDGSLTGGELLAADLTGATSRLSLNRDGVACPLTWGTPRTIEHSDGVYARVPFEAACAGGAVALHYDFFFDLDPQHRAVVRAGDETFVLSAGTREHALDARRSLVLDGVWHILSGLDHVLFLLALLLPSVLRRTAWKPLLIDVLRVVTAFTVAHSLTLALASLGVVSMDAAWVEPAIAASVAIAALDNLWPVFGASRASIAFALGLLHGFGFSSVLSDLGLSGSALLRALVSFNVGVELGQLGLIVVFLPLAYLVRDARAYRFVAVRGGSLAIAACALVWFAQRLMGAE